MTKLRWVVWHRFRYLVWWLLMTPFISACDTRDPNVYSVRAPSWAPDNQSIVATYSNHIHGDKLVRQFFTGTGEQQVQFFPQIKQKSINAPVFSPDGEKIAFTAGDDKATEVYIMHADGSHLRQLTQSGKYNFAPHFSDDGQSLLYVRSHLLRPSSTFGETMTDFDIYKFDLSTGKESRLTYYHFYKMSDVMYLAEQHTIIFDGTPAGNHQEEYNQVGVFALSINPDTNGDTNSKAAEFNKLFVMPYKSFDFIPAFTQQDMDYISFCSISRDGRKIAFFVRANKMDGVTTGGYIYDVFLRENGRNTRVTHLGAKYRLYGVALSPDGSRLTLISEDRKTYENRLWVGNSDGSDMRDITLSSEQVAGL